MYAILMSVLNLAQMLSYQLGGLLTYFLGITEKKFDNLLFKDKRKTSVISD